MVANQIGLNLKHKRPLYHRKFIKMLRCACGWSYNTAFTVQLTPCWPTAGLCRSTFNKHQISQMLPAAVTTQAVRDMLRLCPHS